MRNGFGAKAGDKKSTATFCRLRLRRQRGRYFVFSLCYSLLSLLSVLWAFAVLLRDTNKWLGLVKLLQISFVDLVISYLKTLAL